MKEEMRGVQAGSVIHAARRGMEWQMNWRGCQGRFLPRLSPRSARKDMTESAMMKHPVLSIHCSDGFWAAAIRPMPMTIKARL